MSYSQYCGYQGYLKAGHGILYIGSLLWGTTKPPYMVSMSFRLTNNIEHGSCRQGLPDIPEPDERRPERGRAASYVLRASSPDGTTTVASCSNSGAWNLCPKSKSMPEHLDGHLT